MISHKISIEWRVAGDEMLEACLLRIAHFLKSQRCDDTIFSDERHDVGDGSDRADIQVRVDV